MGKSSLIKKMTGREDVDAGTMAAVSVVEAEGANEQIEIDEKRQREAAIAHCHEVIGRIQGLGMVTKFADVSNLMWLKDVKDQKIYKDLPNTGTWQNFCDYIGLSRQKIDEDLLNLRTFGEAFLADVSSFRVGYRELRKLRQISSDGNIIVDAEFVTIGEEKIPLSPDHTEDLQAAIENLLENKTREAEEARKAANVKERQLRSKEGQLRKAEKRLATLEGKAEERGYTAAEEAYIKKVEAARVTIDGFMMDFDPDLDGVVPEDATARMKAAYMTTLGYLRRVITAMFDTASDIYGDADMDDNWLPPHLRPDYEPDTRPDDGPDCRTCEYHKGMMNPEKGVKIPGESGKCTHPDGICKPIPPTAPEA